MKKTKTVFGNKRKSSGLKATRMKDVVIISDLEVANYNLSKLDHVPFSDYLVITDGGSRNNGSEDSEAYGSFFIERKTGQTTLVNISFKNGTTNNEAEYLTVINALMDLYGYIKEDGYKPEECDVVVCTDSQLVIGQVTLGWKVNATNLKPLVAGVKNWASYFKSCEFKKLPRKDIVAILGH